MDITTQKEVNEFWKDTVEYAIRFWPRERIESLHEVREQLFDEFARQCNIPGQTAYFVSDDEFAVVPDGKACRGIPLKDRPIIDSARVSWLDYDSGIYD